MLCIVRPKTIRGVFSGANRQAREGDHFNAFQHYDYEREMFDSDLGKQQSSIRSDYTVSDTSYEEYEDTYY